MTKILNHFVVAVLAIFFTGSAMANSFHNQIVTLRNVATGRVLDSNGSGNVYTLNSNGGSYQKWVMTQSDYGTYVLRNLATGFVLDSNTNGNVYTLSANGGNFQKWDVTRRGHGFVLKNLATGLILDSNHNGNAYTLGDNGGDYQKWEIIFVSP